MRRRQGTPPYDRTGRPLAAREFRHSFHTCDGQIATVALRPRNDKKMEKPGVLRMQHAGLLFLLNYSRLEKYLIVRTIWVV